MFTPVNHSFRFTIKGGWHVNLNQSCIHVFAVSMQTMKLKISDDAPWKHAAQEVVNMLKNVRSENAEGM